MLSRVTAGWKWPCEATKRPVASVQRTVKVRSSWSAYAVQMLVDSEVAIVPRQVIGVRSAKLFQRVLYRILAPLLTTWFDDRIHSLIDYLGIAYETRGQNGIHESL